MTTPEYLSGLEKAQIALAAAMGAGCRTCADKLYPMLQSLGASQEAIERAFSEGLGARESATALMRSKAHELIGRIPGARAARGAARVSRASELMRIGAGVAANAAPAVAHHIERAQSLGATLDEIRLAIGIGRMVRSKAQGFADTEVDGATASEPVAEVPRAPCPLEADLLGGAPTTSGCCS
jgi:hypothetical protein